VAFGCKYFFTTLLATGVLDLEILEVLNLGILWTVLLLTTEELTFRELSTIGPTPGAHPFGVLSTVRDFRRLLATEELS